MALVPNFFLIFDFAGFREQNTRLMAVSVKTVLMARFGPSKTNQNARFRTTLADNKVEYFFKMDEFFIQTLNAGCSMMIKSLFSRATESSESRYMCFFFQFSHAFFFHAFRLRRNTKNGKLMKLLCTVQKI